MRKIEVIVKTIIVLYLAIGTAYIVLVNFVFNQIKLDVRDYQRHVLNVAEICIWEGFNGFFLYNIDELDNDKMVLLPSLRSYTPLKAFGITKLSSFSAECNMIYNFMPMSQNTWILALLGKENYALFPDRSVRQIDIKSLDKAFQGYEFHELPINNDIDVRW